MPKITFSEYRPGRWVKQVDGKIIGPATAEEVAAWKREKAAPARIWDDVVATVSGPESAVAAPRPSAGEDKLAEPPAAQAGAPAERAGSDRSMLWEDLVKRTKPAVQAESPPRPRPRKEDTEQSEQAEIWQDVVKRVLKSGPKPERRPAGEAPVSPEPAESKRRPAARVPPTRTSASASAAPAAPVARPPAKGATARKASAAKAISPRLPNKPPEPAEKAATRAKREARPAPRPVTPARRTAKAAAKPDKAPASPAKVPPAEPSPAPKAPATRAAPPRPAAKPAARASSTAGVAPRKTAPPTRRRKPAGEDTLPARLLDEIEEERAPAANLDEAPSPEETTTISRPRSRPGEAPRHPARKSRTAAPQERPNQLYLWIAAGQTDDLIATVRTGLARYQERFSHAAEVVLCHSTDLATLEGARLPVDLREGKSLAPRNFWIGLK